MLVDLTLRVTPKMISDAQGNEKKAFTGHLGTHFDVMNKKFPLEFTERMGYIYDVSHKDEVDSNDIDLSKIKANMFIGFYTGFSEKVEYGCRAYFTEHPQLSNELIDTLLNLNVSIIGIDCAGIRRGVEHTPIDQKCAEQDCFVVENLTNLKDICHKEISINTYPMNFSDMTGLPCRVVAKI
jgi:kynurenine formamidase